MSLPHPSLLNAHKVIHNWWFKLGTHNLNLKQLRWKVSIWCHTLYEVQSIWWRKSCKFIGFRRLSDVNNLDHQLLVFSFRDMSWEEIASKILHANEGDLMQKCTLMAFRDTSESNDSSRGCGALWVFLNSHMSGQKNCLAWVKFNTSKPTAYWNLFLLCGANERNFHTVSQNSKITLTDPNK